MYDATIFLFTFNFFLNHRRIVGVGQILCGICEIGLWEAQQSVPDEMLYQKRKGWFRWAQIHLILKLISAYAHYGWQRTIMCEPCVTKWY